MKKGLAWLLLVSLSIDNVFLPFNLGFEFRLQYIIFIIATLLYTLLFRHRVKLGLLFVFIFVGLFLLAAPTLAGRQVFGPIQQLLLICVCLVPFYFMLSSFQFDVKPAFNIYLNIAVLISLLSLIQFVSFFLNFKPGYDFSYLGFDMSRLDPSLYRVQGWMMEPSFLAYFLLPGAFFSIVKFFNVYDSETKLKKLSCFLIFTALLLTQSLIAYAGILLAASLIILEKYSLLRRPASLFILSIFFLTMAIGLYNVPLVRQKLDDTVQLFSGKVTDYSTINLSSFHVYNNALVTLKAVEKSPLVGVGLGNFHLFYKEHALPVNDDSDTLKADGASLFLRLIAETGVPFTFFFLWLVYGHKIKTDNRLKFQDEWIINNGIFVLIVMRLIRMGHYTTLGFPFFLILFFLTFANQRQILSSNE